MFLKPPFFLWAHRGASAFAPENTLAAFQLAERLGCHGLELDVRLSADGVPVVLHDATVDRTTSGQGRVDAYSAKELQRLDAGCRFAPRYCNEPLPLLEEVFQWAGARLPLNLEIKTEAAVRPVCALSRRYPETPVLISSFDHELLETCRDADATVSLGFLTEKPRWREALRRAQAANAFSFHPEITLLCNEMIDEVTSAGLSLFPYTVDDCMTLFTLKRQGVNGVFTNRAFEGVPRRFLPKNAAIALGL